MRPEVQQVDHAVLLTPGAVSILVSGLAALEQLAGQRGARLTPALRSLAAQLAEAAEPTGVGTGVGASTPVPPGPWLALSGHDMLDTDEAAAILGCSASNIRDHCRRGTLPAHRTAGRWLLEREGVQLRAG